MVEYKPLSTESAGEPDSVDLFVGGLAETQVAGSMVGPTFQAIIVKQFENLRSADRLFFENQPFGPALMRQIHDTTLSGLIERDTNTSVMQQNAFVATVRHASNVASANPAAPQLVIGIDADHAVIAGSPGVDNTVVAGLGRDQTLTGGGSSDTFVFIGGGHTDAVSDFRPGADRLDFANLAAPASFRDVRIAAGPGGDAVVSVAGNTVELTGVAVAALSSSDFLFTQDLAV